MSKDSPLYFKPQWNIHQIKWMWDWLKNCRKLNCNFNTAELTKQAIQSQQQLDYVVKKSKVKFDRLKKGSRIIQWGFAPVGGAQAYDTDLTPNNLVLGIALGTVTVATT